MSWRPAAAALAAACAFTGTRLPAEHRLSAPDRLPPIARSLWQPRAGDVVLTATRDPLDGQIRGASGAEARFSHSALVVPRGGGLAIVEATPFGAGTVAYRDLAEFTTAADLGDLVVMRPRRAPDARRLAAAAARLVAARIPFDYALDADDPSQLYCSELVADLLAEAGAGVGDVPRTPVSLALSGTRMVIMPDAFTHADGLAPVFRRRLP